MKHQEQTQEEKFSGLSGLSELSEMKERREDVVECLRTFLQEEFKDIPVVLVDEKFRVTFNLLSPDGLCNVVVGVAVHKLSSPEVDYITQHGELITGSGQENSS